MLLLFSTEIANKTIKQADVLMLGYPLNWNVSRDVIKNDLEYHEELIDPDTPAMTYGFMAVAWKFAEDFSKMRSTFRSSYENYFQQPFKVWKEYSDSSSSNNGGTVNFMPGQGAFIQSIVYGFAGVRIRPDKLEFHNPMPPPDCRRVTMKGTVQLHF